MKVVHTHCTYIHTYIPTFGYVSVDHTHEHGVVLLEVASVNARTALQQQPGDGLVAGGGRQQQRGVQAQLLHIHVGPGWLVGWMYMYIWTCMCEHVCMYVCIYVCMYVCMNMSVCMYLYVCMNMYVCMYVCMYMCVCMYEHICMYTLFTNGGSDDVCMYVCTQVYLYFNKWNMYVCTYVCWDVCMYICTYICKHTLHVCI